MTKKQLQNTIEYFRTISEGWLQYRNFIYPGLLTPELEAQFPTLKSELTAGQKTLLQMIQFDNDIAQTMLDTIGRISSPREGEKLTTAGKRQLESEWNAVFILLQETIGLLEFQLDTVPSLFNPLSFLKSSGQGKHKKMPERDKMPVQILKPKKFRKSAAVQLILGLVGLAVIVGILFYLGIIQEFLP